MSEIKLIINGKECVGQKGWTILQVAEANGIDIPTLCHNENVKHYGACGVCVGHEGCGEGSWGLCDYPLAMAYAPCQIFRALYDPATALSRGTLFTELDLPFGSTEGAFTAEGCACRLDRGERRRS